MEFKGVWNAATNTPTLANGTGNAGDVYLCNVAGTVNFGAGPITFAVGDYAVYTGTVWARSSGATGTVTSVGLSRDGDALSVTGSPITTSGTINIGFAGTNLQYINGAGNLVTFPDLTVYVPTSRTLTINDVTYDLSANRTWTIDSMIYPEEGIAVSTGTAWGDSIVDNSSNWNTAYNNSIVSAEVTGTTTKTLTLDQQDGGTITASWTDYDTAPVTSVFGRTGAVAAVSGDYTTAQVTESGNLYFTDARARLAISLTTLGTSGAATYNNTTGVLNIPNYTTDLTGYVPYTGATTNVNLGVHSLSAYDLIINHTSGSGVAASITKGGSGEALTVVKSSGSGNAASITGGVTLLSELHLTTDLADAYIASAVNWNTAYTNRITSATSPLSITSNVISISLANTSTSGYLSSTDWNTFNGKQNALTNPVTGTGTTNTLPKFTGSSSIGNSLFTDNGTNGAFGGANYSAGTGVRTFNITAPQFAGVAFWTSSGYSGDIFSYESTGNLIINADPNNTISSSNLFLAVDGTTIATLNTTNINFDRPLTIIKNGSGGANNTITGSQLILSRTSGATENLAFRNTGISTGISGATYAAQIIADGDNALEIYSTAAFPIIFGTNTIERYRLSNGGNLLIGTQTDSGYKLNVSGTSYFYNSGGSLDSATIVGNSGANALTLRLRVNNDFAFMNWRSFDGTELLAETYIQRTATNTATLRHTINNGGTPVTYLTIASTGAATFSSNVTAKGATGVNYTGFTADNGNTAAVGGGYYLAASYGSTRGIFGVAGAISGNVDNNMAIFAEGGAGQGGIKYMVGGSGTASHIMTSDGNVMFGTTSGVSGGGKLQVNGNVNINGVFQINGVTIGGGGGGGITGAGTTSYIPKWTSSTSLGNSVIYDNGTNVGIGTTTPLVFSASYRSLDIRGTGGGGVAFGTSSGSVLGLLYSDAAGLNIQTNNTLPIAFLPNGSETMRIVSNGNVLINTTSDNGFKLQINGSVSYASGFLSIYRGSTGPGDIFVGNTGSTFYIGGNTQITGTLSTGNSISVTGSVTATAGFFDTSDARLKTLVEDNYLLSSIANVKAKLYKKDGRMELGYYAQDLEFILPSAVKEGSDGFLSLSYAQVHTAKIAVIEDQVTILKNRVSELEKQLNLN
jgi:hypothetical protein